MVGKEPEQERWAGKQAGRKSRRESRAGTGRQKNKKERRQGQGKAKAEKSGKTKETRAGEQRKMGGQRSSNKEQEPSLAAHSEQLKTNKRRQTNRAATAGQGGSIASWQRQGKGEEKVGRQEGRGAGAKNTKKQHGGSKTPGPVASADYQLRLWAQCRELLTTRRFRCDNLRLNQAGTTRKVRISSTATTMYRGLSDSLLRNLRLPANKLPGLRQHLGKRHFLHYLRSGQQQCLCQAGR